jgi:hypothetical protein
MNFSYYTSGNSDLPDNHIYSVAVEASGIVWAGTQQGGLARLDETLLTGLTTVAAIADAGVYPVPAQAEIRVKNITAFDYAEVIGMNGQTAAVLEPVNNGRLNIELLEQGVYFLRLIEKGQAIASGRFVVIR